MPSAPAGLETELKFELDSDMVAKLREHPALSAPADARRLNSVYFDTPHHDLRNSGVTLRVRETEGGYVQTVKRRQGAGLFDRDEWECAVPDANPDPAAFHKTPAGGVLNGEAHLLAPVFATVVDRRIHLWRQGDNLIEVSLDEGEITAGDQHEPIRELELELKSGEPQALFSLARDLAERAPMRLSFESKGERGYRLAGHDGVAAIKAERTALSTRMSAGEAFRRVARSALAQISGNAQLLRRASMPDALHQTRVGLRRLRAALAAFKSIVDDDVFPRIRAETKWLAKELDEARDIDVFLHETFAPAEAAAEEDPALAALGMRLRRAQAEAYERAKAAIDSPRFAALLLDVAAWVEVGPWTAEAARSGQAAAAFGAASLARLHRKLCKGGGHLADLEPPERHKLRIRAKKLRYAAEFFAGAFGRKAERRRRAFLAALKALQDDLGQLNDIAVARTLGPRFVGQRSGDLAFTAGLIVGRREKHEPHLLKKSVQAFEVFEDARPFWPD